LFSYTIDIPVKEESCFLILVVDYTLIFPAAVRNLVLNLSIVIPAPACRNGSSGRKAGILFLILYQIFRLF